MNTLNKFQQYMGSRKVLLPIALLLSALSALAGMLPFVFIWLIVRELLKEGPFSTVHMEAYAWWAAAAAVVGVVLYFSALMCSHLAAFRVETNLRYEAMKRVVKMPLGFFDRYTSGKIRKVIDDNAGITHSFLAHQLPDLSGTVLIPLVAVALILFFDWRLGLVCFIPIVVSLLLMGKMMGKGRYFMETYMTSLEDMNTEAVEYVRGIPVVKVFQQTLFSFKNFYKSIMDYKRMVYQYTVMWKLPMSAYTVIINSFVFVLAPFAILMIGYSGSIVMVLLNFFLYVLLTPIFSQCVMKSMYLSQAMGQATEAIKRLEQLTGFQEVASAVSPRPMKGFDISLEQVSFTYPNASRKAVDGVSFSIPQGKTVALVGHSGSGKTTIARLIPRFWEINEGHISIGGIDVKEIAHEELMANTSFVFQHTKLFKTTLLENIKYGNPEATLEEVERAIDVAQCRDIIEKQPLGLHTKIGTEGTYLSGGEQQRIVLARAILKNAPIVILDEATAFADPENEHLIQEAFKALTKGKTVLMIAHRLTSVKEADEILVIEEGRVAEQGTHEELLAQKGIYLKMWNEYQQSVRWTIGKEDSHD